MTRVRIRARELIQRLGHPLLRHAERRAKLRGNEGILAGGVLQSLHDLIDAGTNRPLSAAYVGSGLSAAQTIHHLLLLLGDSRGLHERSVHRLEYFFAPTLAQLVALLLELL